MARQIFAFISKEGKTLCLGAGANQVKVAKDGSLLFSEDGNGTSYRK